MSVEFRIKAQIRNELGRNKIKKLRLQSVIPAVMYGAGQKTIALSLDKKDFEKIHQQAGESSLINLNVDGKDFIVVIHELQHDPLKNQISHVDFQIIKMDEKMTAEIELEFTGESPAVKQQGGILVKNMSKIEVECLPKDLPHHVTVDISLLEKFEDNIRIKDLKLAENVTVLNEVNDSVVTVTAPRSEEELKALNESVSTDVSGVEVVGEKEKKEAEAKADEEAKAETDKKPQDNKKENKTESKK